MDKTTQKQKSEGLKYNATLKVKTENALLNKAQQGWCPIPNLPWGYVHKKRSLNEGTIIVTNNSWRKRVVQREFELRAYKDKRYPEKFFSLNEIRHMILKEGLIPKKFSKQYSVSSINRRLTSTFYDCRFNWQGVEYPGKHKRFISRQLFLNVQLTFTNTKREKNV